MLKMQLTCKNVFFKANRNITLIQDYVVVNQRYLVSTHFICCKADFFHKHNK